MFTVSQPPSFWLLNEILIYVGSLCLSEKKMVVRIRLSRFGCKNRPFYRVVAADSRYKRDGRHLEILGYYNPLPGQWVFYYIYELLKYQCNLGFLVLNLVLEQSQLVHIRRLKFLVR